MSDESALLKAVLASPDDDLPRLVYADWLDGQGRSYLAEFIRTQIELFRTPEPRPLLKLLWAKFPSTSDIMHDPDIRAEIQITPDLWTSNHFYHMVNNWVDWEMAMPNGGRWSGTGILISAEQHPARQIINLTIRSAKQESHRKLRERRDGLKRRQQELWGEAEVRGYYNRIHPNKGSTQVVIGPWEEANVPNSYTVGRVVRGMVEEIRLPILDWISPCPAKCHMLPHGYVNGEYQETCRHCPTYGQVLVKKYPLTKVIPADKEPLLLTTGTIYGWYRTSTFLHDGLPIGNHHLPDRVFDEVVEIKTGRNTFVNTLDYWAWFDNQSYAMSAVSQALLALAKS